MKNEKVSDHYNEGYFKWQSSLGEFGGWANKTKFSGYITSSDTVLDFGCGGGYLLKNIDCKEKIGVEINPEAINTASKNGIKVFRDVDEVPDESVDVIVSDNALEHTLRPLDELKSLYKKLKKGGKIIFVVPCESVSIKYKPNDINHHLYSWSPISLGNLITEAGFNLVESKAYIHKWPPKSRIIASIGGRLLFEVACRIYGRIERSWFQVRAVGTK
ncbi:MAG: class I SAM-dependent methyltransferase [bacterium]|nr:class I SAM-dependent methyltransferase [bacterium]